MLNRIHFNEIMKLSISVHIELRVGRDDLNLSVTK